MNAPARERYDGPIEPGMTFWAPDDDGNPYRRDLILGRHPFKPDLIIYEALPCPMRKRIGSGVGEIGRCPEINLRIVMRPEDPEASGGRPESGTPPQEKDLGDDGNRRPCGDKT